MSPSRFTEIPYYDQLSPIMTLPPTELSGKKFFGGSGDLLGHLGEGISFPIYFSYTIWKIRESRIYRRPLDVNMKNTVVLLTVSASTPSSELKKLEILQNIK
eukprot:sb/3478387/